MVSVFCGFFVFLCFFLCFCVFIYFCVGVGVLSDLMPAMSISLRIRCSGRKNRREGGSYYGGGSAVKG